MNGKETKVNGRFNHQIEVKHQVNQINVMGVVLFAALAVIATCIATFIISLNLLNVRNQLFRSQVCVSGYPQEQRTAEIVLKCYQENGIKS